MKLKSIFAATMAVAALFGCSEPSIELIPPVVEEPVVLPETQISFAPYIVHTTKAQVTTTDVLKGEEAGFAISAVYTKDTLWNDVQAKTPAFMYNQQILWDGEKWDYNPPKFWPTIQGEMVSFFAHAPYNAPGITLCDSTDVNADPSRLHFRLSDKSNETIDFIAACILNGIGTVEEPRVMIELKPELTRVEMYAKVEEDLYHEEGEERKTRVIIKSARFTGPKCYLEGEYFFNTENPSGIGNWNFTDSAAGDYPINLKGEDFRLETASPYIVENAVILTSQHAEYQLLQDSAPDQNYIFLLPPNKTDGIEYGDLSVAFDYDIVTEDPKLPAGYSCIKSAKTVQLPIGTLRQGYSYKFTFRFCLDRIEVSAAIVPSGNKAQKQI